MYLTDPLPRLKNISYYNTNIFGEIDNMNIQPYNNQIQNQNIDEKSENNSSSSSFDEDLKKEKSLDSSHALDRLFFIHDISSSVRLI